MKRKREIEGDKDEELTRADPDARVVGVDGDGIEFFDSEEDDEDDHGHYFGSRASSNGLVYNFASLALSTDSISTLNSSSDLDTNPTTPTSHRDRSTASSFISNASDDNDDTQTSRAQHEFHQEATSSLYDSLLRGDDSANMQLELNALRLSTNASEHSVRRAVAAAFDKYITVLADPAGTHAMSITAAVNKALPPHKKLLSRILFDRADDEKSDQVDLLLLLQADLAKRRDGDSVLLLMAKELVQLEVLEAEGLEQWWENAKSSDGEEMVRVRAKTKTLVDFLCASDDDESSGEEEEESGDDD
jgi:translation initiation factor eIF-2B subunit epsilon